MKKGLASVITRSATFGLNPDLLASCKRRLLEEKSFLLNHIRSSHREYSSIDHTGGDEADQSMAVLAENDYVAQQIRSRDKLLEIELALKRIEIGTYGICEETEEPIETERLLALPWTRLSIEGAEIREAVKRRFAGK
jgi:DnaK suppressor protein